MSVIGKILIVGVVVSALSVIDKIFLTGSVHDGFLMYFGGYFSSLFINGSKQTNSEN